jgi:hypothetical protein
VSPVSELTYLPASLDVSVGSCCLQLEIVLHLRGHASRHTAIMACGLIVGQVRMSGEKALVSVLLIACVSAGFAGAPVWAIVFFACASLAIFFMYRPNVLSTGLQLAGTMYAVRMLAFQCVLIAAPFFFGRLLAWGWALLISN